MDKALASNTKWKNNKCKNKIKEVNINATAIMKMRRKEAASHQKTLTVVESAQMTGVFTNSLYPLCAQTLWIMK